MRLSINYKVTASIEYRKTPIIGDQGVVVVLLKQLLTTLPNNTSGGVGNGEVSNILVTKGNASTGGTSLSTYGFTNVTGDAVSITYIRCVLLVNNSSTVGENILLGGSFSLIPWLGGTNPQDKIPPGGFVFRTAPNGTVWQMSMSGLDIIEVFSSSGTPEYELYIAGV